MCRQQKYNKLFRVGDRYGKGVTVENLGTIRAQTRWKMQCDCGNTYVASAFKIANSMQISCGCMRAIPLLGKRFHQLLVIEKAPSVHSQSAWKCKCDCGNTVVAQGAHLRNSRVKSCGCGNRGTQSPNFKGVGEISSPWWTRTKRNLKRASRTLPCSVSLEDVWELFLKQDRKCALTGLPIGMKFSPTNPSTASLDRIDSRLGYVPGNIQWVHKDVNGMKWDMDEEDFVSFCRLVVNHSK